MIAAAACSWSPAARSPAAAVSTGNAGVTREAERPPHSSPLNWRRFGKRHFRSHAYRCFHGAAVRGVHQSVARHLVRDFLALRPACDLLRLVERHLCLRHAGRADLSAARFLRRVVRHRRRRRGPDRCLRLLLGGRARLRRPPAALASGAAGALFWLGICLVPGFLDDLRARVIVSSLFIAPLLAMSALEFWRARDEPLLSRWPVIVLYASFSLMFASRIAFVDLLPFPFGALPAEAAWVGLFNLIAFFHALVLTVLMVAISKERLELDQRQKAQTDPLTGALNRRAFMTRGTRLLHRHRHDKQAALPDVSRPRPLQVAQRPLRPRRRRRRADAVRRDRARQHPPDRFPVPLSAARSSAACCPAPRPSRRTAWPSASATASR